jgi:hypothetical protein
MFKNPVTNEYFVTPNNPDVVVEIPKPTVEEAKRRHDITLTDSYFRAVLELAEMIRLIQKKRPHWTFKNTIESAWHLKLLTQEGHKSIDKVQVYDGDDYLGWVGWGQKNGWGSKVYEFDNFRLRGARTRGSTNYSSKAETAASRIIKTFHSKTPKELMDDAVTNVSKAAHYNSTDKQHQYHVAYRKISNTVERFVVANWQHIQPELGDIASGMDLPELITTAKRASALNEVYRDGHGWVILAQTNGRYITRRDGIINTYTDADLPDRMRMGLGLLKMVEDGRAIEGVGVRGEGNVFFVADEMEEERT